MILASGSAGNASAATKSCCLLPKKCRTSAWFTPAASATARMVVAR